MQQLARTKKGLTFRDGLWLVVALAAHALLFLVPIRQEHSAGPKTEPLMIELQAFSVTEPPVEQTSEPIEETEWVETTRETDPLPPNFQKEPPLVLTEVEPLPQPKPEDQKQTTKNTSTAVLLQSAIDRKWSMTEDDPHHKLGVFVPQEMPENWRPGITLEENRFNGMTVPGKVEIVDRWTSMDGSNNVVINTPTGETLCGRAQAWDPMQPLVEHVMQFRPCGGGGKRSFEMPERYRKNNIPIGVANSTTN